jgi:hypothetical protein
MRYKKHNDRDLDNNKEVSEETSKDLTIGIASIIALFLLIALLLSSCTSSQEISQRKLERAKRKMDKLILNNPSLIKESSSTTIKYDTVINNRVIHVKDSIYIPGSVKIDTLVQFKSNDSIIISHNNLLVELLRLGADKSGRDQFKVNVKETPRYIYRIDTLTVRDTVFMTETNKIKTITIDTKPSFLWSLWFQVKGWLWFILIIVAILVILRIIFKFLG